MGFVDMEALRVYDSQELKTGLLYNRRVIREKLDTKYIVAWRKHKRLDCYTWMHHRTGAAMDAG